MTLRRVLFFVGLCSLCAYCVQTSSSLLNTLTAEEVQDLVAYYGSGATWHKGQIASGPH